jgi:hypothetical protein
MASRGRHVFPKNAPDQSAMTGLEGQPLCTPILHTQTQHKPLQSTRNGGSEPWPAIALQSPKLAVSQKRN